jgi:hypothetical protein
MRHDLEAVFAEQFSILGGRQACMIERLAVIAADRFSRRS